MTMTSATEYRTMAADCIEIAKRMSLHCDRERLMEMAERWLLLAVAEDAAETALDCVRSRQVQQCRQLQNQRLDDGI